MSPTACRATAARATRIENVTASTVLVAETPVGEVEAPAVALASPTEPVASTPVTAARVAKLHPVLFPALMLPLPVCAKKDAPPVAALSFMDRYETSTVPLALLRVARVPDVLEFSVTRLPAVPARLRADTVVVVLAGSVTVAGCVVLLMSLNVFAPVIVRAPAPPWDRL
jgi:hypothetical protein